MTLDEQARELAMKSLKNKWDWQAYLVLTAAESRIGKAPEETADEKPVQIDSFAAKASEWCRRGDPACLDSCLSMAVATMSELLALADEKSKAKVIEACRKIGNLVS